MNALQKFVLARAAKTRAEKEEATHRKEALALLRTKKMPILIEAGGCLFVCAIEREQNISVREVESVAEPTAPAQDVPQANAPTASIAPAQRKRSLVFNVSEELHEALVKIATDEKRRLSAVVEDLIATGFVRLNEGATLPGDVGSGPLAVSINSPLASEVVDLARELGESTSKTARQLVVLGLRTP